MNITWKNCIKVVTSFFALFLGIYYWKTIASFISVLFDAVMPIIVGLAIAYVLNILMSFYENHYFTKFKGKKIVEKSRRGVCLVSAILTLVGIVALIVYLVVPELVSCVKFLTKEIPPMIEDFLKTHWVRGILPEDTLDTLKEIDWMTHISGVIKNISSGIGDAVNVVVTAVSSVVSVIVTVFISIIFSIYLLYGKNTLQNQGLRVMNRYLPDKITNKIMYVLSVLNESFHRYIVGQCTEAVILGVLCSIGMTILRFPYAGMIGTLIGFTALIPIAGAYIGAGIGAIMMLTISPMKAIWFIIFIIALQQIEGNLIYPKVVGKSLGLPAMWVLAAITIGGSLMGIFGMLLGVPVTATLYRLLREDINKPAFALSDNDNVLTSDEKDEGNYE